MRGTRWWRGAAIGLLATGLVVGGIVAPAAAAVTRVAKVVQEGVGDGADPDDEARFPDLLKLADGRLMAVWHQADEHQGTVGVIQIAFDNHDNGRTWPERHNALANQQATMGGKDTRDPKLAQMSDGSVLLTFFVAGAGVYFSIWHPGWHNFNDPKKLVVPGLPGTPSEHGSILPVAGSDPQAAEVLIPLYLGNGAAYFARGTYRVAAGSITVRDFWLLEGPSTAADGWTESYYEPSFVQFGGSIVAVVRHERVRSGTHVGAAARIITWSASAATPTFTKAYWNVQANSHHLLKTADGRLLFTYGDKAVENRPTFATLISNPTVLPWRQPTAGQKIVPIYNSGFWDQANPSSVETSPGVFLTAGYNAKQKAAAEGPGRSPSGGTLWLLETRTADY